MASTVVTEKGRDGGGAMSTELSVGDGPGEEDVEFGGEEGLGGGGGGRGWF